MRKPDQHAVALIYDIIGNLYNSLKEVIFGNQQGLDDNDNIETSNSDLTDTKEPVLNFQELDNRDFDKWCIDNNLLLTTRQLRQKAERMYDKHLKKMRNGR